MPPRTRCPRETGRRIVAAAVLALWVGASGCRDASAPPAREPDPSTEPAAPEADAAPDITLTDQNGQRFRLSALKGRLVLLFFGYTYCPDVCPTTLASWSRIEDELGEAASEVVFVFITVDPERDSAERLKRHLAVFSPRFVGLRGTAEELARVYEAYRVVPRKVPISEMEAGYLVDHPNAMILVDRAGRIAGRFDYRKYPPEITAELARRLGETSPSIRVVGAWSWPTATEAESENDDASRGERGPGVAYLSIRNEGDVDDRLLEVRSDVCAQAQLHETRRVGDHLRMAPHENGLVVPAGETVKLEPGGSHIMLMGLRRDLLPRDRFDLVLVFERAGERTVESEVRQP